MINDKYGKPIKIENDFPAKDSTTLDFYFNVWCNRTEFTQAKPWKIQQIVAQDMQNAAEMFIKENDKQFRLRIVNCLKEEKKLLIKSMNEKINDIDVFVQDWRGRISQFEIILGESIPIFYARRIK